MNQRVVKGTPLVPSHAASAAARMWVCALTLLLVRSSSSMEPQHEDKKAVGCSRNVLVSQLVQSGLGSFTCALKTSHAGSKCDEEEI